MGKDLYYTIPQYFEARMAEHSVAGAVRALELPDECVYEIERPKFGDRVKVWLSDAYLFTEMDFHNRPKILASGDYVLIAKPEGGGGVSKELVKSTQIGVGKLKEFMGALTKRHMWTYEPSSEEEKKSKAARWKR